jgi:hypothetical protein
MSPTKRRGAIPLTLSSNEGIADRMDKRVRGALWIAGARGVAIRMIISRQPSQTATLLR